MSSRSDHRTRENERDSRSHSGHRHSSSNSSSNRKRGSEENPTQTNDESESKRRKRDRDYSEFQPDSQNYYGGHNSMNDFPRRTSKHRGSSWFSRRRSRSRSPDSRARDKYNGFKDRSQESRQGYSDWTRDKNRDRDRDREISKRIDEGRVSSQTDGNKPHTSGHGRTKPEESHVHASPISSLENQIKLTSGAGKLVEEVEKRKLLFSKKEKPVDTSTSVWDQTKFSHDSDGAMTAKFKRLMGIKHEGSESTCKERSPQGKTKQDEYFENLEKQYEVARATTHTQRGLGLGFTTAKVYPPKP